MSSGLNGRWFPIASNRVASRTSLVARPGGNSQPQAIGTEPRHERILGFLALETDVGLRCEFFAGGDVAAARVELFAAPIESRDADKVLFARREIDPTGERAFRDA